MCGGRSTKKDEGAADQRIFERKKEGQVIRCLLLRSHASHQPLPPSPSPLTDSDASA